MTTRILAGDCRSVLATLPEASVDAVVTDPPYGLSDPARQGPSDRLLRIATYIGLPNLNEIDPELAEQVDLAPVTIGGSSLTRAHRRWIDTGIGVPVGAVDFDRDIHGGNVEIEAGSEAPESIADAVLTLIDDAEGGEFLGDYILDTRDTRNPAFRDVFGRSLGEYGSGRIAMPVVIPLPAGSNSPLTSFLLSSPAFGSNGVGGCDSTQRNAGGSTGIVTSGRAELRIVLAFDGGRCTGELFATHRTGEGDGRRERLAAKLVRATPATRGLSPEFQPVCIRVISDAANRASAPYFHLWVRASASADIGKYTAPGGFMGKGWDHEVPGVAFWEAMYRVMKPGAHLLAFGGTRTFHRIAVAIEDAGFEIRDTLMWLYGSGFPKSLDVGKAIDKAAGAEREVVGTAADFARDGATRKTDGSHVRPAQDVYEGGYGDRWSQPITAPATPQAQEWAGWGTALKPAYEPIILARKPLIGTVAANVLTHGTGALNIDGCRIGTDELAAPAGKGKEWRDHEIYGNFNGGHDRTKGNGANHTAGRWPANVVLDEAAAEVLDEQSGERTSGGGAKSVNRNTPFGEGGWKANTAEWEGDSGGASRFFYVAKASRRERNAGLDSMPERVGNDYGLTGHADTRPGRVQQERSNGLQSNHHPTVKPVALMRWLVRLITPPGGTVLDPFMGSGSTGVACLREGVNFIGIELNPEYAEIARRRIEGDAPLFADVAMG